MYLDTVNYEHLAVSQQQFLQHLAAAGIPEAHLELHRMQQEAAAAAADPAVDYGSSSGVATPESEQGAAAAAAAVEEGAPAAAAASVARAAAEGAAAAQLRQEQAAAGAAAAVADVIDVLEGLQLAEDNSSILTLAAGGESAGLGSVQTSQPATPLVVAASREGSLPSLSPLGTAQSPVLLDSAAGAAAAAAATATAALPAASSSQDGGGGAMPRGLSFDAAADLASAAEQPEQQEQQAEQQWQHQAGQEGRAEVAAAAAGVATATQASERYAEAALIEEMVAEGTRHVLAAEAAGMLQQRYPFMYAQAEDLSLVSEPPAQQQQLHAAG